MIALRDMLVLGALSGSLAGCYAYAGPPRHARHPPPERVVVVHERARPAPVVVRERVVVHERSRPVVRERVVVDRRHKHHRDNGRDHDHDRD